MNLDFLFLHPTTHFKRPHAPTGMDNLSYAVMPVGTIALANLLHREGYETKIIHSALEQSIDHGFDLKPILEKYDPPIVGIDLHWYVHAYDAIQLAQTVKQYSNAFTVLGGFTASFFAKEILSHFPSIDGIICGDAEQPLCELLQYWDSKALHNVSNLIYRDRLSLKQAKKRFIASESDINPLNFSDLSRLEHYEQYIKLALAVEVGYSNMKKQAFPCLGRGCSHNCSYCGGGQNAYQLLTGRTDPLFLAQEKVVEQLTAFEEMKISSVYMGFDPCSGDRQYHKELFSSIRQESIDIGCQFEIWDLTDKEFIHEFRRTFNPLYSSFVHSIQSGSEEIRKLNVGYYYSNATLFHWLRHLKDEFVPIEIAFAAGLPWETEQHFNQTIDLAQKIINENPLIINSYCIPLNIEPCSPMFLSPQKYGLTLKFKEFRDYYNFFKHVAEGTPLTSILGYETNQLSEPRILQQSQRFYQAMTQHSQARTVAK